MKIGVIFQCQFRGIANCLRALIPDAEVYAAEIGALHTVEQREACARQLESCDEVIALPIGATGGPLFSDALRQRLKRVHFVCGVSFPGFHPDIVYVDTESGHLRGAVGSYHSRIAIAGYLAGLSVRETVLLFNTLTYGRLGYFGAYALASEMLIKEYNLWSKFDISDNLKRWRNAGCFMHTSNHPKIFVLYDLTIKICNELLGLQVSHDAALLDLIPDNLDHHGKFSVYPEIAQRLGVAGGYYFKPSNDLIGSGFSILTLQQFVERQYDVYGTASRSSLLKADGVDFAASRLGLTLAGAQA